LVLDRKIALVLMALTGFFYYLTYLYPPETMSFPRFLLYSFGILSLFLFLFPGEKKKYDYQELFAKEKIITLIGAVIYVSLIHVIGFFVSSFLFILVYICIFEKRALRKSILIAAAGSGVAYIVFEWALSVHFPEGFLL
jgi:putative tricarboxylic transport membrane protein